MILYYMTMYKFGYDFEIITDSLDKGFKELKKVYFEWFKNINERKPTKEEWENAKEDIEFYDFTLNRVRDF